MSDLYDDDILIWSEHQFELLRRLAAGEPMNETPDWINIIEEVADVGRDSLGACRSQLFQALLHNLERHGHSLAMRRIGARRHGSHVSMPRMPSRHRDGNESMCRAFM
jgi:hypothetical protein